MKKTSPAAIVAIAIAAVLLAAAAGAAGGAYWQRRHAASSGPGAEEAAEPGQLWTCGMHPQVIQEGPGICPICRMKLTPAGAAASSGEGIAIDPVVVENMGIRVAPVVEGTLRRAVRAPGYVREAEPTQHDVTLKVGGWVKRLHANTEGMHIQKGAVLFEVYSPELFAAQAELIAARRALEGLPSGADPLARREAERILDTAREKLLLWDVDPGDLDAIAGENRPRDTVLFRSPADGHVVEKLVVEGSPIEPGKRLFRIVDHSTLWLDASIYERDIPFVAEGQTAEATTAAFPGRTFSGRIILIHPHLDMMARTATARILVRNPDLDLKPGMYAAVELPGRALERTVLAPREAIIDTGIRQVAFVHLGGGRFDPRDVKMGIEGEKGMVQILDGLKPGELVVTSGQFLLDAESRTREATRKFLDERRLKAAGLKPPPVAAAPAVEEVTAPPLDPAVRARVAPGIDALLERYLEAARALARDAFAEAVPAARSLPALAQALADAATGSPIEAEARKVLEASAALEGLNALDPGGMETARRQFRTLSDAVIALVKRAPPSPRAAARLSVIRCPMFPGDWLQTDDAVRNPYYGAQMLECGEVVSRIRAAP
jgi:multidrug efflux pump subunit AcrA (membrane-fusion protein)